MKRSAMFMLFVLAFAAGPALAQTRSTKGTSSSHSTALHAREAVKPEGTLRSKDADSVRVLEAPFPWLLVDPPKRFLWGDVDQDGLKDLFVLDFRGNLLFHNRGDGGFEDVTAPAFPDGAGRGATGFFGDYDGDGRVDLFLFRAEGFTLFRNDGGLRFLDVTETLGLDPAIQVMDATLEDFDGDGRNDLIVETPGGDRIFRNEDGQRFGEVPLPEPDRRFDRGANTRRGTYNTGKQVGPATGPAVPGTPGGPETMFGLDGRYVNDNSPGSVGIGIPEVEGGDDGSVLNDIVDGTIAGKDLGVPFAFSGASSDTLFHCINSTSTEAGIALRGESTAIKGTGIYGVGYRGVYGESGTSVGVYGNASSDTGLGKGVYGRTQSINGFGVYGQATQASGENYGVYGTTSSAEGCGVYGEAKSTTGYAKGVFGTSAAYNGTGVYGISTTTSGTSYGVYGENTSGIGAGVKGASPGVGVKGHSTGSDGSGVYGTCFQSGGTGVKGHGVKYGVYGIASDPNGYGGYFVGRASTDVLEIRGGSDLSERFDVRGAEEEASPAPGMVVCIDPERTGELVVSTQAYDRKVAGVISGAGGIRTGMLMGQEGTAADGKNPVALTGRVCCLAEATTGAIAPGDLLTTSHTPGHAMKVTDHAKAQGAILGKAMSSLKEGKGLVLVLVTLQ